MGHHYNGPFLGNATLKIRPVTMSGDDLLMPVTLQCMERVGIRRLHNIIRLVDRETVFTLNVVNYLTF